MQTLADLATLVGGTPVGDSQTPISGVSEIQRGKAGTITFLSNLKYKRYVATTKASAIITTDASLLMGKPGIIVPNPQLAVVKILQVFHPPKVAYAPGIHRTAVVDPTAELGEAVAVGAFTVIESGAKIGDGTRIGPQCFIGGEAVLGNECILFPGVQIYSRCVLGHRVVVHSGTVIGSDGFGFVTEEDVHHKIPQVGRVVMGDDVEIGANCAFDRGTLGDTIIGPACKFDNLVHIAHNVRIGAGCLLTAHVAVAGSVVVGDYCIFAGQAGVAPHLTIGDKAVFAAKTGVTKSLPGNKVYAGMPAREIREQHKREAVLTEIERIKRRLGRLEKHSTLTLDT